MNCEAPDGSKRHNRLWNGGNSWGTVKPDNKQNGESGAGKARDYVIPAILETEGSMIVTDTKGDIYDQVAGPLRARGFRALKLDFRDTKLSPLGLFSLGLYSYGGR